MPRQPGLLVLLVLVAGLAVGALAPTRAAEAARPRTVKNEPYSAELRARVRTAIRKGITHIRTSQKTDDASRASYRYEEAAAVLWVLRRAGMEPEGPEDESAFRILRERAPGSVREASLLVLALCTERLPEGDPFVVPDEDETPRTLTPLPDSDRGLVEDTVALLLDAQSMAIEVPAPPGSPSPTELMHTKSRGGWARKLTGKGRHVLVHTTTTYMALLALEAASRRGVRVPDERFLAALELLLRWQSPKGRTVTLAMNEVRGDTRLEWKEKAPARGYGLSGSFSDEPTGYDTAAAAAALVICKDALQGHPKLDRELERRTDEAIRDALAWIQKHYTIRKNPNARRYPERDTAARYHHHWLQALARLAIHLRLRFVGKHDWYREGAELLMRQQQEDGNWRHVWWSNCYALLFLQRASLRSIVPVITPSED